MSTREQFTIEEDTSFSSFSLEKLIKISLIHQVQLLVQFGKYSQHI